MEKKIIRTVDILVMMADNKKLPKKVKLLSPEVKDEFRILTYDGDVYSWIDGYAWQIIPEYLHLNDEIEILEE